MRQFEGYKKGVNLGGWISQCGPHYNEEHYSTFITREDIKTIADWGLDHVRLPVDYNVIQTEEGELIESGLRHIDDCIEWCREFGLKIVLDLHKCRGFVFDDVNYTGFFDSAELQDQFVSLWEALTRRYAKFSDMITFELLNEVTEARFAEKWNNIAERTVAAIRKLLKDVKILIGGIFNSSIYGLTLLRKPADENIVFSLHCYSPMVFTHQSAGWVAKMPRDFVLRYPGTVEDFRRKSLEIFGDDFDGDFAGLDEKMMNEKFFINIFKAAERVSEKYNVPLYCGEYGVIDRTDPADQLAWYKDMNAALEHYDLARAAWSYKGMDFGLSDARLDGVREELIKYL